jgi:PadR family transcriptional regulator PadR
MLGEFEYLILSAAMRLGKDAYGAAIRQEIEDATGDRCSIGALYTTLDRLEAKGFVKTRMGDPTPQLCAKHCENLRSSYLVLRSCLSSTCAL